MKTIVINEFGGPSVMEFTDVDTSSPGPGEVLIAIETAGVNHVDIDVRAGTSGMPVAMPHIPGGDAAEAHRLMEARALFGRI